MNRVYIREATVGDESVHHRVAKVALLDKGSEFVGAVKKFESSMWYGLTLLAVELRKSGDSFVQLLHVGFDEGRGI